MLNCSLLGLLSPYIHLNSYVQNTYVYLYIYTQTIDPHLLSFRSWLQQQKSATSKFRFWPKSKNIIHPFLQIKYIPNYNPYPNRTNCSYHLEDTPTVRKRYAELGLVQPAINNVAKPSQGTYQASIQWLKTTIFPMTKKKFTDKNHVWTNPYHIVVESCFSIFYILLVNIINIYTKKRKSLYKYIYIYCTLYDLHYT